MKTTETHMSIDGLASVLTDEGLQREEKQIDHELLTVALIHNHLPKLADGGIIEYDTRTLEVRYHGNSRLEDILEAIQGVENNK